jgi:hypothetical protein
MSKRHVVFEVMFFIGLVLLIIPFFIDSLFPWVVIIGLIFMVLSAARERIHLLKHK